MKSRTTEHYFLKGGGEMGELIRNNDWSKTPLGDPANWPQSLRTMVSVMLDNPFGMYIAWGQEYTQIYNDGYRPILGSKKHPQALGISTRETFSEIWHIIESMFNGVMDGVPIGFPDFMLPLDRNGYVETCYFDFAYSPIRTENGEVGGVLVTVIETTNKKKAEDALKDSKNQLEFAIDATQLGTFDYNPKINKFSANNRLKEWFGLPEIEHIELTDAIAAIHENDKLRVTNAIKETLEITSGGKLEVEYTLVNPISKKEIIVHAKGRAWFDEKETAYRLNGTLEDVTEQVMARQKIEESEQNIRTLVESAPFPIGVYTGKEMRITLANQSIMDMWGKGNNVIGKLYTEILPELENQQIFEQIKEVFTTGIPFHAQNQKVDLLKNGKLKSLSFNYNFTPLFDASGNVYGVMSTAAEVTEVHEAKQKVEAALAEIKLFKFMADTAGDPFILMDEDGRFVYVNDMALHKWGYTREEVKHLSVPDVDTIYHVDKFREIFKRSQNNIIPPFETLHKNKQGIVYPVEISIGSVQQNGKPLMFAIARDIRERKEAEQAIISALQKIEESEKRFKDSVKQAPLGIAILRGPQFIVEIANENYLLLVDKKEEGFIGKPLFESLPEVQNSIELILNEILRTGAPFYGNEFPVNLKRYGKHELTYFNFVYHPLKEETGEISGIMVVATEVTTTVKAKHLLEESENHFRHMVMQSPIPMTILRGKDFIIKSANKAMFENVWRKKEADVIDKSILVVFPELKEQKYPELLKEVFTSGATHSEKESVALVQGDDGLKKFYLDFEYAALFEPNGTVSGIMITVNDVTDKVEARQKIEENEERLNIVINASELGIWEYNLDTKKVTSSKRCQEIFGVLEQDHISRSDYASYFHPDDRIMREKAIEKSLQAGFLHYEGRIIWEDKSIHWVETKGKVFYNSENKPERVIGTVRDITEEKKFQNQLLEREQKFRLLADSMAQHVWTSDPEGKLNYFNKSVFEFSGLSLEQLNKDGWLQIVHPDDREKNMKEWLQSISTGKDFLLEHRFRKYDGLYRWQLSRALPQKDKSGKITMWVGTSTDIQEQKMFTNELEEQVFERTSELNQKNLDLEKMNKELQAFAYISSHDLQEPLRKIQTFASQITDKESKNLSDSGIDKFHRMQNAANRMQHLIQDLLAYSRTSTEDRNFETLNLKNIIEEVKEDLLEELLQKHATIDIGKMCEVKVIPFQFRQLIFNLVSNSLKFTNHKRAPRIKIKCEINKGSTFKFEKLTKEIEYCHIRITDNGIGFEQKYSERIFEVFQRLHGKEKYNGTGIGLAIVKKIVDNHNGFIMAKGELNKGATFDIYLPIF